MYDLYKQQVMSASDPNGTVSSNIFRKIFNENFNLHFHPTITDSCKRCDEFENKIKACDSELEKQELKAHKELHLRRAEKARQGMQDDGKLAKLQNKEFTAIAFDFMKTLPTPDLSTGICYYKRQLWTYCFGVHNLATNEAVMYTWNESVASRGPQEIGSCLMHYIKNFVKTKKLIMYSDQCGGQNRNIKRSLICNFLVSNFDFNVDQIDHKFLCSGHAYLPCDQDFGLIKTAKKCYPFIYVPDDWNGVIRAAQKKAPFKIVTMDKEHFFSSKSLENNTTRRKISKTKQKVEWLKIQWLRFESHDPFCVKYKYTNQEDVCFNELDIKKRNSKIIDTLELLFPNGNCITVEKKKDLLQLMAFVPPIHHDFFKNLRTTAASTDDVYVRTQDSDFEDF